MFGLFKSRPAGFSQLGITVDWHCHLLPGVDDGIQKIEDSVKILQAMHSAGITTVVHTPHINPEIFPDNTEASIRTVFERYLEQLPSEVRDGMNIRLAGEYMVVVGFEHRDMKELLQIEPGKVLIEMSYLYPSPTIEESIFNISMAGLVPVIAHPERYLYYSGFLDRFDRLRDMGAEFQLNLLSLGGGYGSASVRIMEYLLHRGMYSYAGTDTHTSHQFHSILDLEFPGGYLSNLSSVIGD